MAWLNSDDLLLPGSLATVARYFVEHPEVDAIYGHRIIIDEDGDEVGRWVLPPHEDEVLRWADYVPQETLFWRRSLWERAGGRIDDGLRFAIDWDLLLRFLEAGATIVRLPRFLGCFRVHDDSKTVSGLYEQGEAEMALLRERVHGRRVDHEEIWRHVCSYVHRAHALQQFYETNSDLF